MTHSKMKNPENNNHYEKYLPQTVEQQVEALWRLRKTSPDLFSRSVREIMNFVQENKGTPAIYNNCFKVKDLEDVLYDLNEKVRKEKEMQKQVRLDSKETLEK